MPPTPWPPRFCPQERSAGQENRMPETALAEVEAIKTGTRSGVLARFFRNVRKALRYQEDLKTELDAKTAEIQRDLDMARDFQRAFLPHDYPTVPTHEDQGRLTLNFITLPGCHVGER
jgi:hypothetical protein